MDISVRNPAWGNAEQSVINCECIFPWLGNEWVPFSAMGNDSELHGKEIFDAIRRGKFGPITPFVSSSPAVPQKVTRRQFKLALLDIGILDDVEAMIAASNDRALQINWAEALDFERSNPFIAQMAAALSKTAAEVDALFVLASGK